MDGLARAAEKILSPHVNCLAERDSIFTFLGKKAMVRPSRAGTACLSTGMTFEIDGTEVLSDDNAGRTMTTVALFMSDQNENKKSDLGSAFSAPFVQGTDVYMASDEPAWVHIEWQGTKLRVPNWPSDAGLMSILLP